MISIMIAALTHHNLNINIMLFFSTKIIDDKYQEKELLKNCM